MTVVISVPGNGTRSLLRYQQLTCTGPEKETGPWHIYHFGEHDAEIAQHQGPAHIPLRNPVDVMISWLKREKPLAGLFEAMERMALYQNTELIWHRAEDLPIVIGHQPYTLISDRQTLYRTLCDSVSHEVLRYYRTHGNY